MSGVGRMPGGTRVAPQVTTAAQARAYTRSVVREQWDSGARTAREEDVIDLLLVVSELVTNAIRHGGGLGAFEVALAPDGVRVAVRDSSDAVPDVARRAAALPVGHHAHGYGWPLVVRLTREIVIDRHREGGKTIRVLVPLHASG
ncbi:ATP-binding protein [Streptomyces sp. NPDC005648]|uniref:ATP-binding protein n=1 Tax=Streptomyces sp. NPDC005648 TaxID=3157044 RepID=UPI0033AB3E39